MEEFFDTIFASGSVTPGSYFAMAGTAILAGILFAFIMSFKVRSNKRFFLVNAIMPVAVGSIICFVSGNIGAGIAIGGAFALVRFRSAPGSSDEIAAILITMAGGIAFGMGYLAYGVIIMVGIGLLYLGLTALPIFTHKGIAQEKLLRVTIPESLDYAEVFDETFAHYLKESELVGTKLVNMGSMFRLSYRIRMKNVKEEKEFIDELRTKNANLEIALTPYVSEPNSL